MQLRPEGRPELVEHREHRRLVGDVDRGVARRAARGADGGDDLAAGLLAAVGDHHRCALGREPLRGGPADARASARDERHTPFEPFHGAEP